MPNFTGGIYAKCPEEINTNVEAHSKSLEIIKSEVLSLKEKNERLHKLHSLSGEVEPFQVINQRQERLLRSKNIIIEGLRIHKTNDDRTKSIKDFFRKVGS